MAASKNVMEGKAPYKAERCYKIIQENIGRGTFFTAIPQYVAPFLFSMIQEDLSKGVEMKPLEFPNV